MKVRYLKRATNDLIAIANFVRKRNPHAAELIGAHIRTSATRLEVFPKSGRATSDSAIRVLTIVRYSYLVFYEVRQDSIVIHHIRDARREPIDPGETRSL